VAFCAPSPAVAPAGAVAPVFALAAVLVVSVVDAVAFFVEPQPLASTASPAIRQMAKLILDTARGYKTLV